MTLPRGVIPSGAVVTDAGAMIVWSIDSSLVLVYRAGTPKSVCRGQALTPVGAAFVAGGRGVEIVDRDGEGARVLHASDETPCATRYVLTDSEGLIAAARLEAGWVIAVRPDSGVARFRGLDESGRTRWTFDADSASDSPLNPLRTTMTSAGRNGIILASITPPFRSVYVDASGTPRASLQADTDSGPRAGWLGLRVLRLAHGYLQVLADPRSDRRHIVLFGESGAVLRRRDLDVAFGFVASSPSGEHLLALRRTNVDEMVVYRVLGSTFAIRR